MADETRTANVQLTANVDQYQQATAQAARSTNVMTDSVNRLVSALDGITKRVGKKLLLFSAADAAAMAAYTALAAKHEKQLSSLSATTAVLGKSNAVYRKGIEDIARQLPVTGEQVTRLITQITKLGVTSERQALAMSKTFINLSAATGENIDSLAQSMIELSRQMGTLNGSDLSGFADSLTTVATKAGVSATGVLQFAQAIAPMARAAGIGQKEVIGIATAFSKAGADGFAAANTFNTMISDITRQVMNGSPQLAKYSNVVGMTVDQFKGLSSADRLVAVFDAVNKAGPDSIRILDRLGFDGIRAAKSIQAVAAEQGGLRAAIEDSVKAFGNGKTQTGAEAAFGGLEDQMVLFRNNLEQIAVAIGEKLVPVATAFMGVMNKTLDVVNQLAGPLLNVAGLIGGLLAPVAAAVGTLMTALGPLSTVMMAMTLFRLSPMRAGLQGIKEGMSASTAAAYGTQYIPTTQAGRHQAGLLGGPLKGYQAAPFAAGQWLGSRLPIGTPGVPNAMGQMALRSGIGAAELAQSWYINPTRQMIANAGMRDPFQRYSATGEALDKAWARSQTIGGSISTALHDPYSFLMSRGGPATEPGAPAAPAFDAKAARDRARAAAESAFRGSGGGDEGVRAARTAYKAEMDAANALRNVTTEAGKAAAATGTHVRTLGEFGTAVRKTAVSAAGIPFAYGRMGAGLAAEGAMKAGGGLLSMLGGMVGLGAPAGAVIAGVGGLAYGLKQSQDESRKNIISDETMLNLTPTNAALGLATESLKGFTYQVRSAERSAGDLKTVTQAMKLTSGEIRKALGGGEPVDQRVKWLDSQESAVAFLKAMGTMSPEAARSLASDMVKQFGREGGQRITDMYLNSGMDKYTQNPAEIARPLYATGVRAQEAGITGFLRMMPGLNRIIPNDSNMEEAVKTAWVASQQNVGDVAAKYGEQPAARKELANVFSLMSEAYKSQDASRYTSTAGDQMQGYKVGSAQIVEQSIKQFESKYGDLGLRQNPDNLQDFYKELFRGRNTSQGAVNFRDAARQAGLSYEDFASLNPDQQQINAVRLQRGSMSAFEQKVRGTNIGTYARNTQSVLDVTEGTKIGDVEAIGKAVTGMVAEVTKGGRDFSSVTYEFQKLKQSINDVNDPLYQLADAAQQIATAQGMAAANRRGGPIASIGFQYNTAVQKLANMAPGDAGIGAATAELESAKQAAEDQGKAYLLAINQTNLSVQRATDDHHRQMLLAQQEFARSMKRSVEDFAKTFYDPFTRVFSRGSVGSNVLITNLKDQNEKVGQQMKNLAYLRKKGLSQQAIDTLQLTDPSKWAQVQRMVDEGGGDIRGINAEVGKRLPLAKESLDSQQSTRRAVEDNNRTRKETEFQFRKSLYRTAEDFDLYMTVISGDFETTMKKVNKGLDTLSNLTGTNFKWEFQGRLMDLLKLPDIGKPGVGNVTPAAMNALPVGGKALFSPGMTTPLGVAISPQVIKGSQGYTVRAPSGKQVRLPYGWMNWSAEEKQQWYWTNVDSSEQEKPKPKVPIRAASGDGSVGVTEQGSAHVNSAITFAAAATAAQAKRYRTSGYNSKVTYQGDGTTVVTNHNNTFQVAQIVAHDVNDMSRQLAAKAKQQRQRQGANA